MRRRPLARSTVPRTARVAGVAVLTALAVLAGGATTPASAEAPLPAVTVTEQDVAAAQSRVDAVTSQVAGVAGRLTEGTARWQEGTARLAAAQQQAGQAQAAADLAEQAAAARRGVLAGLVSADYRSPAGVPLLLKAGSGAAGLTQALRADADLGQVRGSTQDALASAQEANRAAAGARREAEALRDGAAAEERDLAAQLDALQALARRTDAALTSAAGELDRLSAQRADQIAAREAEVARRAEAARRAAEAAAAAAAAKARAARPAPAPPAPRRAASPATGSCAGRSTGGYANGAIPASALCPLSYAPGHLLRADAAAAFNRLTDAAKAARGVPVCVTDSYRSYSEQVRLYAEKPSLAAVPGTSNHGWGVAVDLCGGVQSYGTSAYLWMKANAPAYGWVHPSWAEPGGSRQEPWHWEYVG